MRPLGLVYLLPCLQGRLNHDFVPIRATLFPVLAMVIHPHLLTFTLRRVLIHGEEDADRAKCFRAVELFVSYGVCVLASELGAAEGDLAIQYAETDRED